MNYMYLYFVVFCDCKSVFFYVFQVENGFLDKIKCTHYNVFEYYECYDRNSINTSVLSWFVLGL